MRFFYQLVLLLVTVIGFAQQNQLWKGYYSYQETKAIATDNVNVFLATDNAVFSYNPNSKETEIFNTLNGLKIDGIQAIGYAADYKKIVLGSANGKIAVIDLATDKIYHLYDLYNKTTIPDNQKSINKIIIHNGYAYLATGFGVTSVRLNDNHFGDTFYIGADGDLVNVNSIAIAYNYLYAATSTGIKKASLNSNLIDFNNWQLLDFSTWKDLTTFNNVLVGVKDDLSLNTVDQNNSVNKVGDVVSGFVKLQATSSSLLEITTEVLRKRAANFNVTQEFYYSLSEKGGINDALILNDNYFVASKTNGALSVNANNTNTITTFSPNGPLSNNVSKLTLYNKDLYFNFGGLGTNWNPYSPIGLDKYGVSLYKNLNNWQHFTNQELGNIRVATNITVNPNKSSEIFITSYFDGLAKFDINSKELTIYNHQNTNGIQAVSADNSVRVNGVAFDRNGKGWLTNGIVNPFLVGFDKNFNFDNYNMGLGNFDDNYQVPVIDKNGTKWIGSRLNGLFAFNETRGNKAMQINTNHNLRSNTIKALAIDYNNRLWIGTNKGIRVINNVDQFLTQGQLQGNQITFMFEGKPQELFFEQDILAITIDGSNNKWIAVAESGVFLIADNKDYETIFNFTKENSPLPSNDVLDIKIDGTTGEVFFVTRSGVVSFKNFATTPAGSLDNVKVYPNPVKPGFTGDVKISGLTSEATIKITDVAGNLVYETKSMGGTVTWNTANFSGTKVASGVYVIFVTSVDGTLDAVKKVMIVR